MRTPITLSVFCLSTVLTAWAVAGDDVASALLDTQPIRAPFERDLTNFICGTPDKEVIDRQDSLISSTIVSDSAIGESTSVRPRRTNNDELSTTQPDIGADDQAIPDVLDPTVQHNSSDLTGDGVVDIDDILLVLQGWGSCLPTSITQCIGDVNLDGYVNQHDLLLLLMQWS